tara:strand:- start:426 stop:1553 length:1128 start_codon:yes stop_codon:yes gene_type:complete
MEKLNALTLALRQNAQGEADLGGLNEDYARAENMRNTSNAKVNQYGTVSPFAVMADVINQSRGRKDMREIAPQRTAARSSVANNANALPLYRAQQMEQQNKQAQDNFETTNANRLTQATTKASELKAREAVTDARYDTEQSGRVTGATNYTNDITGEKVKVYRQKNGSLVDSEGTPVTSLKNFSEDAQKTQAVTEDPLVKVGAPDILSQILDSEFLEQATGALDVKRQLGRFGYGTPNSPEGEGENIQALQSKMSDIGIDSVKTNLEGLGINPTDRDLAVAFSSIPDADTQPLAWAIWTRDQYLPMLQKAGAEAVANGTASSQVIDQYVAQVTDSLNGALAKYGDKPEGSEGTIMIDANGNRALVDSQGNVIKEL